MLRPVARWQDVSLRVGSCATIAVLLVFLGVAIAVDFPRAAQGFKGDEATYYTLTHSLARDRDFVYQRRDLIRVLKEFSAPEGIFLKRGNEIHGIEWSARFPFVRLVQTPDPSQVRYFYAKSYIYPLFAAPFVALFGTSGFLIFHALLLALDFAVAYRFLAARGSPPGLAAAFAAIFIFASVVPVYFVWLAPELFNFSLVLNAFFLICYRWTPEGPVDDRLDRFLRSPRADYLAAILLGVATFSKPTHIVLVLPLLALMFLRREIPRLLVTGALFVAVVGGLFAWNAAITGDINFQGGNRKSFYSSTGFPFANTWETFDKVGQGITTNDVPLDILLHPDTIRVFPRNLMYFTFGRYSGLLPYFFPGVLAAILFLAGKRYRERWQWPVAAGLAIGMVGLLLYMPYTYSGGGGPIGNRYFLSFYPLFLFLMPPVRSVVAPIVALAIGSLFVAKLVLNPFYTSFNPGQHAKAGPLRLLPIELTLLNDLPVAADIDRARRSLGGDPPVAAYFPDDGAYLPEGDSFWVRGGSRADVVLRGPAPPGSDGSPVPHRIRRLSLQVTNGAAPNRITVSAGLRRVTFELKPGETRAVDIEPAGGVPYRPSIYPTNFVYTFSVSTSSGFVPFLEEPGSTDSRYLGALVKVTPVY
jgi:hypothetical protein